MVGMMHWNILWLAVAVGKENGKQDMNGPQNFVISV